MIIFLGNDELYRGIIKESKNDKDIVVSCQYRHKVPKSLLKSHVCVNVHYGLLPRFAGCNPIYWQMKEGVAGVTLHYMDEHFDSGDIIDQIKVSFWEETADELYAKLRIAGFLLFEKYYKTIIAGTAPRKKQDLSLRKYKKASDVDFDKVKYIKNFRDAGKVSFKGKQDPIVTIRGREWKLIPNDSMGFQN